jgi:Lrp/AsnC family transcriptional regulator, regulator for asnA, asnC and gidA
MARPVPALDEIDRAIIDHLQADGRLPYTRLGAAVGLSEAAARQRVQRLIDAGVMQIVAVTDPLSLGLGRMAMIGVRCEGDLEKIASAILQLNEASYVVMTAGSFDLLVEVVAHDDEHLLELLNGKIRSIAGVKSTETFIYLRLAKQTFSWGTH